MMKPTKFMKYIIHNKTIYYTVTVGGPRSPPQGKT